VASVVERQLFVLALVGQGAVLGQNNGLGSEASDVCLVKNCHRVLGGRCISPWMDHVRVCTEGPSRDHLW